MARRDHGDPGRGSVGQGSARRGKARQGPVRHGEAGLGLAWLGVAWQGPARRRRRQRGTHATQTRFERQDHQSQHPDAETRRLSAEAGRGDRHAQGRQTETAEAEAHEAHTEQGRHAVEIEHTSTVAMSTLEFSKPACAYPRCGRRASRGSLCAVHAGQAERERERLEPWRAWYRTEAWRRVRVAVLRRAPRCQCGRRGCRELAEVVDHRVPHRGDRRLFWDVRNLQALSKRCHDRKTGGEVTTRQRPASRG